MRRETSSPAGGTRRRLGAHVVVALVTIVATACTSIIGLNLTKTTADDRNHDGTLHLSLLGPLKRDHVGLGPMEQADDGSFVFVAERGEPIEVRLDLPDGRPFLQQANLVAGALSPLYPPIQSIRVQSAGHTVEEAARNLLADADRFGYDPATIHAWELDAAEHFSSDKELHHVQRLRLDDIGHLTMSISIRSRPLSETVNIHWSFSWDRK